MYRHSLRRTALILTSAITLTLLLSACGATATPTPLPTPTFAPTATKPAPTATLPAPTATLPAPTATKPAPTATPPAPTATPPQPLTEAALKNASYSLQDIGPFTLKDGSYEKAYGSGATQVNRVNMTRFALGDLNGDGAKDAAVILALNTGGSGTFIHLVAVLDQKGTPQQAAVVTLGDRTAINSLAIESGGIALDMLTHSASDPLCCPSQKTTRTYRLDGGSLKLVAEAVTIGPIQPTVTTFPAGLNKLGATAALYDPKTYSCSNLPARTMTDKIWQVSAPRIVGGQTAPGKDVEIGLRNKFGENNEQYKFTAYVIAPDRGATSGQGGVSAAEWGMLFYPKNFAGARSTVNGIYTVVYEINGGLVACDGFVIGPYTP